MVRWLALMMVSGCSAGYLLCVLRHTNISAHLISVAARVFRSLPVVDKRDDVVSFLFTEHPLLHELFECELCLGAQLTFLCLVVFLMPAFGIQGLVLAVACTPATACLTLAVRTLVGSLFLICARQNSGAETEEVQ
jgi:hypothetical protein